jgi:hypothetical protein
MPATDEIFCLLQAGRGSRSSSRGRFIVTTMVVSVRNALEFKTDFHSVKQSMEEQRRKIDALGGYVVREGSRDAY